MNSVEAELTTVRKKVTKLKEENMSNHELNATLGENFRKNVEQSGGNGFGYGEN